MKIEVLIDKIIAKYNWKLIIKLSGTEIMSKFRADYKLSEEDARKIYRKIMDMYSTHKIDLIDKWTETELIDLERLCHTKQSNLYIAMQLKTHTPREIKIKRKQFNYLSPQMLTSLEKEKIDKYYNQDKLSIPQISMKIGRKQQEIAQYLGLAYKAHKRKKWVEHLQILECIQKGYTTKEIVKIINRKEGSLRSYLYDFNLHPKKERVPIEPKILEYIRTNREDKGKTFYAIAKELNKSASSIRNLYIYYFQKKVAC